MKPPPSHAPGSTLQPRWRTPSPWAILALVVFLAFLCHGLWISELTLPRLLRGVSRLGNFLAQAFPPDPSRLSSVLRATLETFEMALVGTTFGALLSLPLSTLAAKNTSPHPMIYTLSRGFITLLRVIPDLVWGLLFIVLVGLGPGAGVLAIAVDVMGFCGKFFAERIEEVEPGSIEALRTLGASEVAIIVGAIFPVTLPSFVASSLYSLESSVRSAVVLGLVGAGGIGVELATSMQLLRYDEALMVILVIFAVVLGVEQLSAIIRKMFI